MAVNKWVSGAALAVLVSAGMMLGATTSTPTKPQSGMTPDGDAGAAPEPGFSANRVNGRIKSVDQATHQVIVDENGKTRSFKLSDESTVFIDGRLGSVDDLREGQEVRAAYAERDGQEMIRWVDVLPGAVAGTTQMEGIIVSLDRDRSEMVVAADGRQRTVIVASPPQISQNGRSLSFADLKEGEAVRASLDPTGKSATHVEVISSGGEPQQSSPR